DRKSQRYHRRIDLSRRDDQGWRRREGDTSDQSAEAANPRAKGERAQCDETAGNHGEQANSSVGSSKYENDQRVCVDEKGARRDGQSGPLHDLPGVKSNGAFVWLERCPIQI